MRATLRLLNAVSHTEVIDGRSITVVYLYGRTADGQSMAVRTPPQAPWFQVVEPPADIIAQLEDHAEVPSQARSEPQGSEATPSGQRLSVEEASPSYIG